MVGHGQSALRRPFRARLCRLPAFPSSITDGTEMEKCVLALASAAFADPSRFATFVESIVSLVLAITILHPPHGNTNRATSLCTFTSRGVVEEQTGF